MTQADDCGTGTEHEALLTSMAGALRESGKTLTLRGKMPSAELKCEALRLLTKVLFA